MKQQSLHIIGTILVFLCAIFVATPLVCGEELYFKSVSFSSEDVDENGMPTVNAIYKDSKNYVWIGADTRLVRFDGTHTIGLTLADENNAACTVTSVTEVIGSGVYVGTNRGLFFYSNNSRQLNLERVFTQEIESVSSMLVIDGNRLLVAGNRGAKLVSLKNNVVTSLPLSKNMLDDANNIIGMSKLNSVVYMITKGGLYKLNIANYQYTKLADYERVNVDKTSIVATPERIYVGTMGNGVIPYNLVSGKMEAPLSINANVVTSMAVSGDYTTLYVGTDGNGVFELAVPGGRMLKHFNQQGDKYNSLHNNQVRSLMLDVNNKLWVGYYQNGADYSLSCSMVFSVFNNPDFFNSRGMAIRAISISGRGLALGTREGLILLDFEQRKTLRINSSNLRSDMVLTLLSVGDKLYVGTYGGGLSVINIPTMTVEKLGGDLDDITFTNGHIFTLAKQADNTVWIGTNTGVYHISGNKILQHYTSANSKLPEGNVYEIFFDSQKKGWICTDAGLCVFDPVRKELRTDIFPAKFPRTRRIRTVYEDHSHHLYFLPEKGNLFVTSLDMADGETIELSNRQAVDAKAVIEDKDNTIWVATNLGVYCRHDNSEEWRHFSSADGIPSQIFLQCQPAIDDEGNIWFGNSDGLLKCNLSRAKATADVKRYIYPVAINAGGKHVAIINVGDNSVVLDEYHSNLSLDFATLSYAIDDYRDYEYAVDGGEWLPIGTNFTVNLEDLTGSHKVTVRYKNKPETEYTIAVKVPYTWLDYAFFAMIVLVLILGVYILQHRFYSRRKVQAQATPVVTEAEPELVEITKKKYSANHISDERCAEIVATIEKVMAEHKPYLNPDMKIADLAALTDVSSHKLSYIFSQYMNVSFYDYVNKFRVDEFKRIAASPGASSLTLSALAEKAGFSSRASFFRYFKEIEGLSPGEYMKNSLK